VAPNCILVAPKLPPRNRRIGADNRTTASNGAGRSPASPASPSRSLRKMPILRTVDAAGSRISLAKPHLDQVSPTTVKRTVAMPGRRKHTRSIAPAGNSDALIPPGGLLPARPCLPIPQQPRSRRSIRTLPCSAGRRTATRSLQAKAIRRARLVRAIPAAYHRCKPAAQVAGAGSRRLPDRRASRVLSNSTPARDRRGGVQHHPPTRHADPLHQISRIRAAFRAAFLCVARAVHELPDAPDGGFGPPTPSARQRAPQRP